MNIAFVDRGRFGGGVGGGAFRGGGSTSSSLLRLSLVGLIVTGMLGRGRLLAAGGGAESVASNGLDWPAGADDVYLSCTFRVSILAFSMMLFGLRGWDAAILRRLGGRSDLSTTILRFSSS